MNYNTHPDSLTDSDRELESEIFNYYSLGGDDFLFKDTVRRRYAQIATYQARILPLLFKRPSSKFDYVFVGTKYTQLIEKLSAGHKVLVIGCEGDWHYAKDKGIGFYFYFDAVMAIHKHSRSEKIGRIKSIVNKYSCLLKSWSPRAVVLINDSLPFERLIVAACRKAGIRSVCLAHGLFSIGGQAINDGKYADVILAYDKFQADILMATGARRAIDFGFYEDIDPVEKYYPSNSTICILGQPWFDYYLAKGARYLESLSRLTKHFESCGFSWHYKPHPSESSVGQYIPKDHLRLNGATLRDAIKSYDIFLSFTSTALLEVTMSGKISIQVRDTLLSNEDFSVYGYAKSVNIDNLEALQLVIKNDKTLPPPSTPDPYSKDFQKYYDSHFPRKP